MDKELKELSLEELWRLFPIILKDHNSEYKNWYEEEEHKMKNLFSNTIIRINHIGSSCVNGLLSKPTVDILMEIDNKSNVDLIKDRLENEGWILMSKGEGPELKFVFNKGYTKNGFAEKVYHLHLRYLGDWDELYFRDYLMEHREVALDYANLKVKLFEKYQYNRDAYTEGKGEFIKNYTSLAREKYKNRYLLK